jgi:hypothetical protein
MQSTSAAINQLQLSNKPYYKVAKQITAINALTETPCGMCPVSSQCYDDGIISPKTCIYMTQWVSMPMELDIDDNSNSTSLYNKIHDIEDLFGPH